MPSRSLFWLLCLGLLGTLSPKAQGPATPAFPDADTRSWWKSTVALSDDSMEGRDTGSAAYRRAADQVARRFAAAGLEPAGDAGGFLQEVPMHQIDLTPEGTSFTVVAANGTRLPLRFLEEITAVPSASMPPRGGGDLTFRGYCGQEAMHGIEGKVVLCFGTQRRGLPGGAERLAHAREGHAAGLIQVDDPYFTLEPPRWPYAYARSVTLATGEVATAGPAAPTAMLPTMRLSAAAFDQLLHAFGRDGAAVLRAGGSQQPLPPFDLPARFEATLHTTAKDIHSPNVLAMLPGSDPMLRDQVVVVSAHLDGYGMGTPVGGDALYNGTLDDAAYVALLMQMADDLRDGRQRAAVERAGIRTGHYDGITLVPPRRSILFCAFTGEEKGLLGSTWFLGHPTVPLSRLAADINLDQLRPLFPLRILTALAVHETTLGETAIDLGKKNGIEVREDREPERALLRRADHYPFLRAGVPAIGFIFGFDPGTDEERRYRQWYEVRYHRPQDDPGQPMDFEAASHFNLFFYRLVETVADDPVRPSIHAGVRF